MWVDVKGFEDSYQISDTGEVRSKDRTWVDTLGRKRFWHGQLLKPDVAPNGYYRITLSKGRKSRIQRYLHRLLAEHFLPNPHNLPQVNHIDGNKLNCNLNNLEWVTTKDKVIHAYKHGLINHIRGTHRPNFGKCGKDSKLAKRVKATNIITGETKIYRAMIETKADGFLPSEVSRVCKHGGSHHGFVFELI